MALNDTNANAKKGNPAHFSLLKYTSLYAMLKNKHIKISLKLFPIYNNDFAAHLDYLIQLEGSGHTYDIDTVAVLVLLFLT